MKKKLYICYDSFSRLIRHYTKIFNTFINFKEPIVQISRLNKSIDVLDSCEDLNYL